MGLHILYFQERLAMVDNQVVRHLWIYLGMNCLIEISDWTSANSTEFLSQIEGMNYYSWFFYWFIQETVQNELCNFICCIVLEQRKLFVP